MNKNLYLISFFICLCTTHISKTQPPLWSILICTLEERSAQFETLFNKLQNQIEMNSLKNEIEILAFKDNREYSVGYKRNYLMNSSKGKYICFIDDDDDISDDYIPMIYQKLLSDPDCVELQGIITFAGKCPKKFIHSTQYHSYFQQDNIFYRPPNHLNPMRRGIAIQFNFPEKNYGEDTDWAMQICKSELLKKEACVDQPYYFYQYDETKSVSRARA